ncbi:hypothetical protein OPV22_026405 [Ensete ventricosum]|uniref:Transmembrane protein n=1 Tax=Ensete ventricosum TaxID=4639 RepID=A0AAV8QHZ2_ENSVE|nr:hypothetical protein OPV22_026405 [Ensete ventricosum]
MDQRKPMICLTLLCFSCILSLVAVPLPGKLDLRNQKISVMKVADQVITRKMLINEKAVVDRRMNIELNDYPVSGANSRHDPKSPGKP